MAVIDSISKSMADVGSEPAVADSETASVSNTNGENDKRPPPLAAKLLAVGLISCISFGSHWSSGVTGAMKSTIKKVCLPTRAD